jgi:multiple sugar transport system substrate-binding protein
MEMDKYSRRSVLRGSLGLAAASALGKPYIAKAQAKTATIWVNQGFVPAEDEAFKQLAAEYMKISGNKLDYSVMPFLALNQKTVSALTSGDVPDLIFADAPASILPQNAWEDKLIEVSDVVKPFEPQLSKTAKECSTFYNKTAKAHGYYLAPVKQACAPFHIWGSLVEKAGLKLSDAPKTWDAFWDFFKPAQKELRGKGMRKIYALGLQITTVGPNDGNNVFAAFMIANGGGNIVTPDGKLHTDDPKVREAAIKSCTWMTDAYKQGYVPPEALSWNDADDNNGYHEKLFVADFDGTISTELAMIKDKQAYSEMVVMGLPNGNDGQPTAAQVGAGGGFIPKGAKNVEVAKDLMKYWMQPKVMNDNLKVGLGRWVPAIPQVVKDDPWWLDRSTDPHRAPYVTEAVLGPTISPYEGFNPAWGQVNAEQLWGQAHADVIKNGMTPEQAIDKAFKRAEKIFSQVTF